MSPPIRHILAATDFSRASDLALQRAARLAQQFGARLSLLHVLPGSPLGETWELLAGIFQDNPSLADSSAARATTEAELALRAERLGSEYRLKIDTLVLEGRAARRIAEYAREQADIDLIVIGAHGQHALRDFFVGSTAQKLLRLAPCGVLLVRQPPSFDYERILLPTDFSAASREAAEWARCNFAGAHFHLAHSFELPYLGKLQYAGVSEELIDHYNEEARTRLRRALADFAASAGFERDEVTQKVLQGYAPSHLVELAADIEADLLLTAASGKSGAEHLFLGSVSLHLALESSCDVLVARPTALTA